MATTDPNKVKPSRVETILMAMLGESVEIDEPKSRVEELLLQLKEAIEQGGGGGELAALAARVTALESRATDIETVNTTQNVAIDERLSGWAGDRASYDALTTKDKELYFIEED